METYKRRSGPLERVEDFLGARKDLSASGGLDDDVIIAVATDEAVRKLTFSDLRAVVELAKIGAAIGQEQQS